MPHYKLRWLRSSETPPTNGGRPLFLLVSSWIHRLLRSMVDLAVSHFRAHVVHFLCSMTWLPTEFRCVRSRATVLAVFLSAASVCFGLRSRYHRYVRRALVLRWHNRTFERDAPQAGAPLNVNVRQQSK